MKNKHVIITIVVLLCIFTPLTIIGLLNKQNISPLEENPNHYTYYNGYMWFYDSEDNYLSKFECVTELCEYTHTIIDDDTYDINYYKDGTSNQLTLIDDSYTFITDGSLVYLYSAETGSTLQTYKGIKNYNTKIEDNSFIVQNSDGVWGVLKMEGMLGSVLPFEYSFIGLKNELNEDGILSNDKFIVSKDTKWYIVDKENSAITGYIDDPIIDYTDDYVFSKNGNKIRIYSYDNYEYLTTYNIRDYILEDKYIGIITDSFLLVYDNLGSKYIKSMVITDSDNIYSLEKIDNKLNIKVNGEVKDTIEVG